jgi:crossover junction endodeoxyribonuclease RuvC
MIKILGIDPGSRVTGYGIIQSDGHRHRYITSGVIKITQDTIAAKLTQIFHNLSEIIQQYLPEETAIEQVFMSANANSALKLGHARGAAILAVGTHYLPVAEYAPRAIKQAVVGYGAADKGQVQQMIKLLLNLHSMPLTDEADALAVAICHAHSRNNLLLRQKILQS